ncbi:MAG: hypothetical protein AB7G75_32915 [Candidatus Binatia bacterium]
MRNLKPPFQFDLRSLIGDARRKLSNCIDGVTINLPFVSFNVKPDDIERKVAREIVIRMADRRVLNAFECCDNCIDQALASLKEIRTLLVGKQVDLADTTEGSLSLLIALMLEAIRQFLTFEQRLNDRVPEQRIILPDSFSSQPPYSNREQYFAALEMLRAHLYRCLMQVSKIADIKIPKITESMRYDETWQLEVYEKLVLVEERSSGRV